MSASTKAGAAWADIKPHAEKWAVDPAMTLHDVSRLSGLAASTVNRLISIHGLRRSAEVIHKANSIRARSVCAKKSAVRWPYRKPTWTAPAPRYPSVWHMASGVGVGGGLSKVYEVRT